MHTSRAAGTGRGPPRPDRAWMSAWFLLSHFPWNPGSGTCRGVRPVAVFIVTTGPRQAAIESLRLTVIPRSRMTPCVT